MTCAIRSQTTLGGAPVHSFSSPEAALLLVSTKNRDEALRRAQTWRLHTKLYKFGKHTSANNVQMKNSRDLNLGEVVYILIIYRILKLAPLLNGYDL